jgi:hypothetical protein
VDINILENYIGGYMSRWAQHRMPRQYIGKELTGESEYGGYMFRADSSDNFYICSDVPVTDCIYFGSAHGAKLEANYIIIQAEQNNTMYMRAQYGISFRMTGGKGRMFCKLNGIWLGKNLEGCNRLEGKWCGIVNCSISDISENTGSIYLHRTTGEWDNTRAHFGLNARKLKILYTAITAAFELYKIVPDGETWDIALS